MELISRGEFAKRMGVTKQQVHKYIRSGLQVDSAGRVEWPAGREWVTARIKTPASRLHRARESTARRQVSQARPEEAAAYRRLMDRLIERSSHLPEALLAAGIADMGVVKVIIEVFDIALGRFVPEFWDLAYGDSRPSGDYDCTVAVQPDYGALAAKYKITGDPAEWEATAERICARLLAVE